jgi:multiple sugar transport system ATP-binding protein
MADIQLERITKLFKDVRAVDDVSLTIRDGEFMVLLGPSGCGKTTLLRSIAGLEQIDGGRVRIGDRDVTDLPPRRRRIAMVFQSYAVFPHMTVFDNIAFGLTMAKLPKPEIRQRTEEAAALLHIGELLGRYPAQVSGGQRQRIAVARAIAMQPQVLLMDEPLSNLDALLRLEMRAELKRLLGEIGSTTVYVTHDQVEALSMGDRVAIMNQGHLIQVGGPLEVYDAPADRFVGGFIGNPPMNFLEATPERRGSQLVVRIGPADELPIADLPATLADRIGRSVLLGIRAENIDLVEGGPSNGLLRGRSLVVEPLGSHNLVTIDVAGQLVKATTRPDVTIARDAEVGLRLDWSRVRWLDPDSGRALEDVAGPAATAPGAASTGAAPPPPA